MRTGVASLRRAVHREGRRIRARQRVANIAGELRVLLPYVGKPDVAVTRFRRALDRFLGAGLRDGPAVKYERVKRRHVQREAMGRVATKRGVGKRQVEIAVSGNADGRASRVENQDADWRCNRCGHVCIGDITRTFAHDHVGGRRALRVMQLCTACYVTSVLDEDEEP